MRASQEKSCDYVEPGEEDSDLIGDRELVQQRLSARARIREARLLRHALSEVCV